MQFQPSEIFGTSLSRLYDAIDAEKSLYRAALDLLAYDFVRFNELSMAQINTILNVLSGFSSKEQINANFSTPENRRKAHAAWMEIWNIAIDRLKYLKERSEQEVVIIEQHIDKSLKISE